MKALFTLAVASLFSASAMAATPSVDVTKTPCYQSVQTVLRSLTDYKVTNEDGEEKKIGSEFVDSSSFTKLPTLDLAGMESDKFFGIVGYARVNYMGDAASHLYTYVVSGTCRYDGKDWQLRDVNLDDKLDKSDISLQEVDFDRN